MLHHAHLISHSQKQVAAFGTVDSDLADDLIKNLAVKLFTDGADAGVPSLHLEQTLV